jgi:hypothetical protein
MQKQNQTAARRYSDDFMIAVVEENGTFREVTEFDMDLLSVGDELTELDIQKLAEQFPDVKEYLDDREQGMYR